MVDNIENPNAVFQAIHLHLQIQLYIYGYCTVYTKTANVMRYQ